MKRKGIIILAVLVLLDVYKRQYESSAGPAHSGDAALIEGEAVTMRSNARYWWHDVKLSNTGSLGNMAAGTNVGNADGEIIYKISAGKRCV